MISGTTQVTAPIAPTSLIDVYSTHDAIYGLDGLRNVNTILDRNSIPNERRRAGMIVGIIADSTYWRLKDVVWDGTSNDWETFSVGGITVSNVFYNGLTQSGYDVKLGGILTENTNIFGSYSLTLGTTSSNIVSLDVNANSYSSIYVSNSNQFSKLNITDSSVYLTSVNVGTSPSAISYINISSDINGSYITVSSVRGIEYETDLSLNYSNRSLVDKEYVVNNIAGLTATYIQLVEKGQPNGVATLDTFGKVPISQLPNSLMEYKGQWDASTNTPTLADGVGNAGDVYQTVVAGTVNFGSGNISFEIGDWAIYSGTIWEKSLNSIPLDIIKGSVAPNQIAYGSNTGLTSSSNLQITGSTLSVSYFLNSLNTYNNFTYSGTASLLGIDSTGNIYNTNITAATFSNYMLKSVYDTDNNGIVDKTERIVTIGRNSTGVTLYRGTVVYILGSTGNRPNFVKAQANTEATSSGTFGIVVNDILNNSDGEVCTFGYIDNLDTRDNALHPFTNDILIDGDRIYLDPYNAGYVTNIKPSAPNHMVYLGNVVRTSPTNGTIVYRIVNGYELEELHNVAIATASTGDTLIYNGVTDLWENKQFNSVLGYSVLNSTLTTTDDTLSLIDTITVDTDSILLIEARVNARKISGGGTGSVGDGNSYIRTVKAKNIGGTVSIGLVSSTYTSEDITPFNVSFSVSGNNVNLNVLGSINNNVYWTSTCFLTK